MDDANAEEVDDDEKKANKVKKVSKRGEKKKNRQKDRADVKNTKDYEYFLRDLEDDPELRADVNLYRVSVYYCCPTF